ncbi:MAG: hypothetical protein GC190_20685 [Alphaproteobacteria bacterium]|nr:hypothetical protein [Alphaproteobacteria bacterium]
MRLSTIACALCLLGFTPPALADAPLPLKLVVANAKIGNRPALAMSLTFRAGPDGRTILHLPNEWASEKELWRGIKQLGATNATFAPPGPEPQTRALNHTPNAEVTVTWVIGQDYTGEPNFGDTKSLFRATVNDHMVVAALQTILPSIERAPGSILGIDPGLRTQAPPTCNLSITFEEFPKAWALATAFGNGAQQSATAIPCDALWDSNLALGDFRIREARDAHGVVRLAVRGAWALSDEALLAKFVAGRAAAADAFQDNGPAQLLISLAATPPLPKGNAVFGTAFSYGFFGFATPNAPLSALKVWWNHEQVHYWIPNRLGQIAPGTEASLAWFNEGFTDYFSLMNAYRTHELTARALGEEMKERVIDGYLKSPVRDAPNRKIVDGFWSNRDLQELPYQRGALLALNWNAEIKKASKGEHSLADVIATLADQANQNPLVMLTPSRLAEAARTFGVTNAAGDIAAHVDAGRLLVSRRDVFGPCANYDSATGTLAADRGAWESAACAAWLK